MAEIFPDEGLDYLIGIVPKNGTNLANTYCGLFTSQTATTVPANNAVLSAASGVAEVAGWGYARVVHAASAWGATGLKNIWAQSGRGTTGAQLSFAAATAAYATAINGFILAATSALGTGPALFYSNFDDTTAVASLSLGDIIKVTPTFGLLG